MDQRQLSVIVEDQSLGDGEQKGVARRVGAKAEQLDINSLDKPWGAIEHGGGNLDVSLSDSGKK